jgi:hypothetical protein
MSTTLSECVARKGERENYCKGDVVVPDNKFEFLFPDNIWFRPKTIILPEEEHSQLKDRSTSKQRPNFVISLSSIILFNSFKTDG